MKWLLKIKQNNLKLKCNLKQKQMWCHIKEVNRLKESVSWQSKFFVLDERLRNANLDRIYKEQDELEVKIEILEKEIKQLEKQINES